MTEIDRRQAIKILVGGLASAVGGGLVLGGSVVKNPNLENAQDIQPIPSFEPWTTPAPRPNNNIIKVSSSNTDSASFNSNFYSPLYLNSFLLLSVFVIATLLVHIKLHWTRLAA